jgi:hypothetical protein
MKIGDKPYTPSVRSLMADTGTSLNMIPESDFNNIRDQIVKPIAKNCYVMANTLTACDCTQAEHEKAPDITF